MMNANELADALDDIAQNSTRIHVHIKEHLTKAATMLRQLEGQLKWEQEEVERVSAIQMKYAEKIEQLQAENEVLKCELNLHKAKDIVAEQRQELVDLGVIVEPK